MPIELAPEAVEALRRIVLPIDNSEHSKRAMDWYFANIQRENDFLLFVHVVEPTRNNSSLGVAIESAPSLLGTVLRVSEESIKEGKLICHEAMQKASANDVKGQAFLYVDTKPAAAILRAIAELKGDLVIIGSRGIGSMRRTILGSVSNHVLHYAHVAVTVIPPVDHQHHQHHHH
ncbi:universal stress protein YxiE [Clonorchis sinensis]|uniref:Universal stress protein YxiE n=1 Tax=Clonorchis sinensis TaxID=79923 RepID=H2KU63_CLOSI|nr:universal stress protein YxiE [Clonorchis sinensis]